MATIDFKIFSLLLSSALFVQYCSPCFAADPPPESATQADQVVAAATVPKLDPNPLADAVTDAPKLAQSAPADATVVTDAPKLAQSTPADAPSDAILRGGVSSDPIVAGRQADDLTRQILLKLIELERFNLHYTLEVAKQGRWKGWRYAAFQEINAGTGLTGSIISTAERGNHLHHAARVSRVVQERANIVPMIGSIIGASAAAMEFGINSYHDIVARNKGFAPKAARLHVLGLKADINRLMAQREALLKVEATSSALAARAEVDDAEGKVLNDLRDESLMEFERYQIGARKILAFQQSQYFFDCTKYTLNAIGSYFAYLSLNHHDRRWNGRAGVMWDISGPVYMAGPIISRVIAKGVGEAHRGWLRPATADAHQTTVAKLEADRNVLDTLCKSTRVTPDKVETAVIRSEMYGVHQKVFADEILGAQKARAKANTTATQNVAAGMYVGASRIGTGVLFTIPGFNRAFNSKTERASTVTNQDLFAAAVIGIPASAFTMLDTLRIQVQGEVNRHKLKKSGLLPGQIAHTRLKQLDEMEVRLAVK